MKFLSRISLVAWALGMLPLAWGQASGDHSHGEGGDHTHSAKDHLYEVARDPSMNFDEAVEQAKAEGVKDAFLIEAKTIHLLSSGNMEGLQETLTQLEKVADELEYGMDQPFHSKKQLIGLVASLRAVRAYEAGDISAFEEQAAKSYVNSPEYNQAFGLLQLMTEVRQKEVQEAAMADLRLPMDLKIASADGEEKTLSQWMAGNQAMLIDFWASWCGPCMQLMPELRAKASSLPSQGVVVVGMNTDSDDPVAKAKKVRAEHQMELMPWLLEPAERPLSQMLMINSIPRMILVGPEGAVLYNGHPMDPSLKTALAKLNVTL